MHQIKFINRDAAIVEVNITCDEASVINIVEWYSAFNAGDDYDVIIDGVKQELDLNGRLKDDEAA